MDVYKKWNSLKWGDNRLCNITRMLDSSKPVLIPNIIIVNFKLLLIIYYLASKRCR